jgi:serine/threonine-protein kinase
MDANTVDLFGLVGHRLDGKYDVVDVVAEGGFGIVYRGMHVSLQKPVAIKVLKVPAELEGAGRKAFLERFAQEARLIAALDHPSIVRVHDFGASPMPIGEAAPWMVLEWLTGTPLDVELSASRGAGGRSPAACLATMRSVFEALAYAHDEGVAHRDIKPPNLMIVTNKRGERSTRVLDFGIAKVMGSEGAATSGHTATQSQQRSYSPDYATPEQLSGTRTGPWTDVYALALVLTELLTDAAPYDGEDLSELFVDVLSPRRPTPAKRGFDVGVWEPVLARAVALKPSDRYADARAFLAALEASVPATVRGPTVPPPAPEHGAHTPDTLDRAKTVRSTAPEQRVSPAPMRRYVGIVAVATLGIVAALTSYTLASRSTPTANVRAPVPVAAPPVPVAAPPAPSNGAASHTSPDDGAVRAPSVTGLAAHVDAGAARGAPSLAARGARVVSRPAAPVRAATVEAAPSAPAPPPPAAPTGHDQVPTE